MWKEIQECKERMKDKEYQIFGATTACVMRGVEACSDYEFTPLPHEDENETTIEELPRKRLFLGDSWFGSVKTCEQVEKSGNHCIMNLKTSHSRSPKKFLEDTMKDYPGGTWIVMEAKTANTEANLLCIGYKYNKKKVLCFVMTRGAGSTRPGVPYEARFPDKYGNVCLRHVARPDCISNYFKYSNKVDLHNQARQFDLALEKKWVTTDPYFRLYTTEVGMTLVDCWKIYKSHHKLGGSAPSVSQFADIMALEMIEYAQSLVESSSASMSVEESCVSSIATAAASVVCGQHTQVPLSSKK